MANTHAIMKSSLAKALIEAGVEHHDLGGLVGDLGTIATGGLTQAGNAIKSVGAGLTQQNGYQAALAPTNQASYLPTIQAAGSNALNLGSGVNGNISQQQTLANQLLAQAGGVGPNPANNMLNQATGQNVANQAALAAGQRGASANPALIAKLAANQGANAEQSAIGQAATMNANQELGAQTAAGNLFGQIGTQALGEQNANTSLYNTAATANNAQNTGQVQNYQMQQGINSGVNQANTNAVNTSTGGLINGLAGAGAAFAGGKYKGGVVDNYETGGDVPGDPKYPGDDKRNDIVPSVLSKGEVVLPNSVTQSADPVAKAAEFMKHLEDKKKKKDPSYDDVVKSKKSLEERVKHLEKLCMGGKV